MSAVLVTYKSYEKKLLASDIEKGDLLVNKLLMRRIVLSNTTLGDNVRLCCALEELRAEGLALSVPGVLISLHLSISASEPRWSYGQLTRQRFQSYSLQRNLRQFKNHFDRYNFWSFQGVGDYGVLYIFHSFALKKN